MACEVFSTGDVQKVLRAGDYLDDPLSGVWGPRDERALEQYLADAGVVSAIVGWVTTQAEVSPDGRFVRLCDEVLGAVHELARRVGFGPTTTAEPVAPEPEPPPPGPAPGPEVPPPAPPVRAGVAPEQSIWAWLALGAILSGTGWVVWRERRKR